MALVASVQREQPPRESARPQDGAYEKYKAIARLKVLLEEDRRRRAAVATVKEAEFIAEFNAMFD